MISREEMVHYINIHFSKDENSLINDLKLLYLDSNLHNHCYSIVDLLKAAYLYGYESGLAKEDPDA